jgi:hypothetical protein
MALKGLHVPAYASWFPAFRAELLAFPAGRHDDIADALGLVGQLMDKMLVGQKDQKAKKPPPRDKYTRAREREENQPASWKVA